jgi:hypothetical protein
MVCFQTKNPNLGKFWKVLQWKMMVFYDHFVLFTAQCYILLYIWWSFGMLYRENSGNPSQNWLELPVQPHM